MCGIDEALASVADHVPDLILTSSFLRPADLARLIDDLRRRDDATHTQVITTPHFLEAPESDPFEDESVRVLRFPRQRTADGRFHCDPVVLRTRSNNTLDQAQGTARSAAHRRAAGSGSSTSLVRRQPARPLEAGRSVNRAGHPTATRFSGPDCEPPAHDRRRASRRRAADLAGQWGIKLESDGEVSIVDISRTGVGSRPAPCSIRAA